MEEELKQFGSIISTPAITAKFEGSDQERYIRGMNTVKESDIVIAECSNPSSGQGMEIRESTILNKDLIVIAKENSKLSGMIKGSPNLKKIIFYNNIDELKEKIMGYFNN